jgi:hypothetical protein
MDISILPPDIQSKILTYYFSYGTPCSKLIKKEINDKCKNNTVTLWRAKIDYEIHRFQSAPSFLKQAAAYEIPNSKNDFLENVFLAQYQPDKKVTRSLLLNKISNKQVFNFKLVIQGRMERYWVKLLCVRTSLRNKSLEKNVKYKVLK